jgi:ribosomal protein S18 acetylase RimI-like enzyme
MVLRRLGPGTQLPQWLEALDQATFGDAWGPLEGGEILLALDQKAFIRWRLIPPAGEAELLRLAVAPEARRQGFAQRLLAESEIFLRDQGITELHLEVRVSNQSARALYEAQGWRFLGIRKAYYRDGESASLYKREIKAIPEIQGGPVIL